MGKKRKFHKIKQIEFMSIAHTLQDLWADHRKIKMIDKGKKTRFYYETKIV